MPTKKEVKKFSEDLVHGIEWVAAEYKYIVKLSGELEQIEQEEDVAKEIKEFKKALSLLRYIGRAERKAFLYEQKVKKILEEILVSDKSKL